MVTLSPSRIHTVPRPPREYSFELVARWSGLVPGSGCPGQAIVGVIAPSSDRCWRDRDSVGWLLLPGGRQTATAWPSRCRYDVSVGWLLLLADGWPLRQPPGPSSARLLSGHKRTAIRREPLRSV